MSLKLKTKETVEKYEEQLYIADAMCSANCYNDLKAWLLVKKNGKRLCDWDDHKYQEICDKMLNLVKMYSLHYTHE